MLFFIFNSSFFYNLITFFKETWYWLLAALIALLFNLRFGIFFLLAGAILLFWFEYRMLHMRNKRYSKRRFWRTVGLLITNIIIIAYIHYICIVLMGTGYAFIAVRFLLGIVALTYLKKILVAAVEVYPDGEALQIFNKVLSLKVITNLLSHKMESLGVEVDKEALMSLTEKKGEEEYDSETNVESDKKG